MFVPQRLIPVSDKRNPYEPARNQSRPHTAPSSYLRRNIALAAGLFAVVSLLFMSSIIEHLRDLRGLDDSYFATEHHFYVRPIPALMLLTLYFGIPNLQVYLARRMKDR